MKSQKSTDAGGKPSRLGRGKPGLHELAVIGFLDGFFR
jgi:hypothetical protein